MTDTGPAPALTSAAARNFAQGLLSFDKLIGSTLVQIIYYVGLVFIGLGTVFGLMMSLGQISSNPAATLVGLISFLIGGAVSVVMWRFVCELWLLAFMIYARMGEIRDRLPPR